MTYDENQMDTVLRECPQCRKSYYMRPWRFVCVTCDDPYRPRRSHYGDRRYVDVQGNPVWPDP